MTIELQKLIPIPLRDSIAQRSSGIWSQELVFRQGEWVKIKAPSGTGKTTLVHSLYGLRNDYTGTIRWDGNDLQTMNAEILAGYRQQQVSVIFQDLRLFPNLTAFENIELKRVLQDPVMETSDITAMAAELGVSHILQQRAGLCSYGEQQRIAIIRALVQPFNWLLMDEPFSHLDIANKTKAAALISKVCKERAAGLIITDLHEDHYFDYTRLLDL